jgi:hypothetical protein
MEPRLGMVATVSMEVFYAGHGSQGGNCMWHGFEMFSQVKDREILMTAET